MRVVFFVLFDLGTQVIGFLGKPPEVGLSPASAFLPSLTSRGILHCFQEPVAHGQLSLGFFQIEMLLVFMLMFMLVLVVMLRMIFMRMIHVRVQMDYMLCVISMAMLLRMFSVLEFLQEFCNRVKQVMTLMLVHVHDFLRMADKLAYRKCDALTVVIQGDFFSFADGNVFRSLVQADHCFAVASVVRNHHAVRDVFEMQHASMPANFHGYHRRLGTFHDVQVE